MVAWVGMVFCLYLFDARRIAKASQGLVEITVWRLDNGEIGIVHTSRVCAFCRCLQYEG